MRVCPKCRSSYTSKTLYCGIDGCELIETDQDPLLEQKLGRYEIKEPLGRGATGCVYRAVHSELGSEFAIKVLVGDLGSDELVVARFRREAQTASKIKSTHVVSVVDFATTDTGLSYLVMEYVQGKPLDALIKTEAPFEPHRAAEIAGGIAAGLDAAHSLGFVHRDVKASNVLVVREGVHEIAKLLDFGIVRLENFEEATKLTQDGRVVGTPSYMAPEQWRGSDVGPHADLYALGVVLYEMLSAAKPFKANEISALIGKVLKEPVPPLPDCRGLENLCYWLLEKDPANRPESAKHLVTELDRAKALLIRPSIPSVEFTGSRSGSSSTERTVDSRAVSAGREPSSSAPTQAPSEAALASTMSAIQSSATGGGIRAEASTGQKVTFIVVGAAVVLALSAFGYRAAMSENTEPADVDVVRSVPVVDFDAIKDSVEAALERRGLTPEDIGHFSSLKKLHQDLTKAIEAKEAENARALADRLTLAIQDVPIGASLLRDKLDRLDGPLASLAGKVAPDVQQKLETEYLELYKHVNEAPPGDRLETVARTVFAFEKKIRSYHSR